MAKKFYTMDDLLLFCKNNKFSHFSSEEYGAPLVIQSFETFEVEEDNDNKGLLPVKLAACHIGRNRNGSAISEENMNKYKDTFKGRPILGSIIKLDSGEYDFHSHDMELVETEDGVEVNYIEQPIGVISQLDDPYLEYDEKEDKTYLMVKGNVFEDYSKAAEILQRKQRCKCSVEIAVEEMSFQAKENCLSIDKFYFTGVTILGSEPDGTEIQEGMAGSNITIDSFSKNENAVFKSEEKYQKLLDTLERLNNTLSTFQINNNTEKGVRSEMSHFEELLEKYGFSESELDFDYENMSDEQLDAAFEEFKNKKYADDDGDVGSDTGDAGETDPSASEGDVEGTGHTDPQPTEPEPSEDEDPEDGEGTSTEDDDELKKKGENFVKNFKIEISHEDIRYALYNLLGEYEEADNEWYGIYAVYDNYFIMQGWCNGKFYKQGYAIDGENVSLDGERTEVFQMLLTESEKIAVEKLRSDYAELEEKYNELKTFKDNYDAAEQKAAKDAIFADEAYDSIRESDEFKALMNDSEKYSVEEIQNKCDLLFAASVKKAQFAAKDKKSHSFGFNFSKKEDKKASAYGNLFKKD